MLSLFDRLASGGIPPPPNVVDVFGVICKGWLKMLVLAALVDLNEISRSLLEALTSVTSEGCCPCTASNCFTFGADYFLGVNF